MNQKKVTSTTDRYCISPNCPADDTCDTVHYFVDACLTEDPYAKAYVVPQKYSSCTSPCKALRNGTYFDDLYMPYVTINPECC